MMMMCSEKPTKAGKTPENEDSQSNICLHDVYMGVPQWFPLTARPSRKPSISAHFRPLTSELCFPYVYIKEPENFFQSVSCKHCGPEDPRKQGTSSKGSLSARVTERPDRQECVSGLLSVQVRMPVAACATPGPHSLEDRVAS